MHPSSVEGECFYGWVPVFDCVRSVMFRFCVCWCVWCGCGFLVVGPLGSIPVFLCSSVVGLYFDVFMGGFRWGITPWARKAMLMRGGACATELCLMVGCVCLCDSVWCWLSCYGYRGCVSLFLVLGGFCTLFDLNLCGFGVDV